MAKETQKVKIERLEKEVDSLHNVIQKLNNEINIMQDNADKSFNGSADYVQMIKHIEDLELKIKVLEESKEHNRKLYEVELKRNEDLNKEIQKLNNEQIVINKHNERGAGRKSRFTTDEIGEIKMYRLQGKTIREIAEMYKCSHGLIHNIVKDLEK